MDPVIAIAVIIGGYVLIRGLGRIRSVGARSGQAGNSSGSQEVDLDALFASSTDQPRLVFLHDPFCPVSALARRQVARVDFDVVKIDVSRQQDLTRQLERRTGIRHESPQIILIDQGSAVWHQSHGRIDREAIDDAFARIAIRGMGEPVLSNDPS